MSLQNPIHDWYAAIVSRFAGPFTVFAKTLTGVSQPPGRHPAEREGSPTPAARDIAHARSKLAEGHPAGTDSAPRRTGDTSRQITPKPAKDPALTALRRRIAVLEKRVVDLETRKAEIEQLLEEFAYCQYRALGDLLGEQLRLQHQLLQLHAERSSKPEDRQAADAARDEHEAFQQARDTPTAPPTVLAEGEREELKALYRAAAMRCHPDRVGEAEKALAHDMFLRTQDAYRRRDLEAMRLIGRQLAAGGKPSSASTGSPPREQLEALLASLLDKGAALLLAIQSIQMQAQYRRARQREKWEEYFAAARDRLEDECMTLRRQVANY